jgi:hypothetical protein
MAHMRKIPYLTPNLILNSGSILPKAWAHNATCARTGRWRKCGN